MAVQTSFSRYFKGPTPGFDSDQARGYGREATNKSGSDLDVGVAVKQYAGVDSGVTVLAASTDPVVGITVNDQGRNPNGLVTGAYANGKMLPIKCEGPMFVQLDQDVQPGDPVYVRFAASGSGALGALGSFRKDADASSGTANVVTVTPTAANATIYVLRVEYGGKSWSFEFLSDGAASATKIVTGLKALMAADAEFTALVVASGTATLILTAQDKTSAITAQSEGDGVMAVANTTPYVAPAATARKLKGARWLSTGKAANGVGELWISASAESP